jgi:hypothetical protein
MPPFTSKHLDSSTFFCAFLNIAAGPFRIARPPLEAAIATGTTTAATSTPDIIACDTIDVNMDNAQGGGGAILTRLWDSGVGLYAFSEVEGRKFFGCKGNGKTKTTH